MRIREIRDMYQGSAYNRERVAAIESINVSNELRENKTAETTVLNETSCLPSSPPSKVLFRDLSFESLDSGI
ncbi:hypothetical protein MFLAVUS_007287 [Mucor flavus]|uniref:Uncharacterized protein n=1 Tax=Mucor flavus TaxID=439312 RepID=A0ABP9Z3V4_9FUNG